MESDRAEDLWSALERAVARSRKLMAEPFDAVTWIMFGVMAFMDVYLAGGGGYATGFNFSWNSTGQTPPALDEFRDRLQEGVDWVSDHAWQIFSFGAPLLAVFFAIGIGLLYLGCRGQMMLIRSVVSGHARLGEHWNHVARATWSLFIFRLELYLFSCAFYLVTAAISFLLVRDRLENDGSILSVALQLGAVVILVSLSISFVQACVRNLIAPVMLDGNVGLWEAVGIVRDAAHGNVLRILGFFAVKFMYSMLFGFVAAFAGCCTCMLGAIPVIHHTIFAPYYVFDRAFSLYVLESLGEQTRIIPREGPPSLPDTPPELPEF